MKKPPAPVDSQHATSPPPLTPPARLRLPLATAGDVRRELARLYREGKSGLRDVADVSRLANVLNILVRSIESSELEERLVSLEERNH